MVPETRCIIGIELIALTEMKNSIGIIVIMIFLHEIFYYFHYLFNVYFFILTVQWKYLNFDYHNDKENSIPKCV